MTKDWIENKNKCIIFFLMYSNFCLSLTFFEQKTLRTYWVDCEESKYINYDFMTLGVTVFNVPFCDGYLNHENSLSVVCFCWEPMHSLPSFDRSRKIDYNQSITLIVMSSETFFQLRLHSLTLQQFMKVLFVILIFHIIIFLQIVTQSI